MVFFNGTGIIGILEALDDEELDMASYFISVIITRLCRLNCGSTAMKFTPYVDLLSSVHRRRMRPECTERDLQTLSKNMDDFKGETCRVLASYQPSGLVNMKFNFFKHLTEDLGLVESIECFHTGLYKANT